MRVLRFSSLDQGCVFGSNGQLFDPLQYCRILSVLGYIKEICAALNLSECAIELGQAALEAAQGLVNSKTIAKADEAGTSQ